MPEQVEFPLFPLHTVLFPGGPLPLQIFESRYLDMVSECLRNDRGFGVCLIREGDEAGAAATTVELGTLARIFDWNSLENGLLGITARGGQRFRLTGTEVQPNQLVVARATLLDNEPPAPLPPTQTPLAALLGELLTQFEPLYEARTAQYDDATWVGYRLAELLPVPLTRKQYFLEMEDPLLRLRELEEILRAMAAADAERS